MAGVGIPRGGLSSFPREEIARTPLRQRMIEDMQLRGFSTRTQESYVTAVRQLAAPFHTRSGLCLASLRRHPFARGLSGAPLRTIPGALPRLRVYPSTAV
jgi:hypothetical protein